MSPLALLGALDGMAYAVLLLAVRLVPVVLLVPMFGGMRVPSPVRLAMIAVLTVGALPSASTVPLPGVGLVMAQQMASQLVVGLLTALAMHLVFETWRMVGQLADVALGRGSFGAGDPLQPEPDGALAQLHGMLLLAVLFASGTHTLVVAAVADGVVRFGPGDVLVGAELAQTVRSVVLATQAATQTAVALAMPALVSALLVDLMVGWINRVLPQLPAAFVAMPLRALVGWTMVAAIATAAAPWIEPALLTALQQTPQ